MNDTVRAYDLDAEAYASATAPVPDAVRRRIERLVSDLEPGARVLEIGSGGGRDARLLEQHGLKVRRTDVAPGFVELLRSQGHACDLLDPLVDDLAAGEGPYDAVWANASLLHVGRADLPAVLSRLAAVTRAGGLLRLSLKEGEGAGWSTHGSITRPRYFTYWRAAALHEVVAAAGWDDVDVRDAMPGRRRETWLEVSAVRGRVGP